jgi:hypothetical protein
VTHGFDRANSHTASKSSKKLLPRLTNGFESKQPLRLQKYSTELLPLVTHGFDSANNPCGFRNHQRNCFHGWRMDSTAQTAPLGYEIINETASMGVACIRMDWTAQRAHVGYEIINKN